MSNFTVCMQLYYRQKNHFRQTSRKTRHQKHYSKDLSTFIYKYLVK